MLKEYIRKIAREYDYPVISVIDEILEKVGIDNKNIDEIIDRIIVKYAEQLILLRDKEE